jgi:uncharacterized protein (DUF488 family)
MTLFTIGHTQTTAEQFFQRLVAANVRVLLDTRARRSSQLSGFAKEADLAYFVPRLTNARYRVEPLLAPADDLLRAYRDGSLPWERYAEAYRASLVERRAGDRLARAELDGACLLCSEHAPERCHRAIAASYLGAHREPALAVVHL